MLGSGRWSLPETSTGFTITDEPQGNASSPGSRTNWQGLCWGLLSELIYAASNSSLTVIIAFVASPEVFGVVAIGYSAVILAVGLSRSAVSEASLTFAGHAAEKPWRIGVAVGLSVLVGGGFIAPVHLLGIWIPVAVAVPIAALQDAARFAGIKEGNQRNIVFADLVWLAISFAGFSLGLAAGISSPAIYLWSWIVGGAFSVAYMFLTSGRAERPGQQGEQVRTLSRVYGTEYLLGAAASVLLVPFSALFVGAAGAGVIRLFDVLLGPLNIIGSFLRSSGVSAASQTRLQPLRFAALAQVVLTVGTVAVGTTIILDPMSLGVRVFGDMWVSASSVAPQAVVARVAVLSVVPPMLALRLVRSTRRLIRVKVLSLVGTLLAVSAGALSMGLHGIFVGVAVGSAVSASLYWRTLLECQHERMSVPDTPLSQVGAKL